MYGHVSIYISIITLSTAGNIEKWEAVKTTLFPNSLLPLIRFLISLLTTTSSQPTAPSQDTQLDMSELARGVVWQCMLEDEYLFFQPLLDQFNKLYIFIKEESSRSATDIEKILVSSLCVLWKVMGFDWIKYIILDAALLSFVLP